jgi:hypothetical protein
MTTISAKVIADSIGEHAPRLTTLLLRYPRWIHAEFMTHRAFSRNASSSRAIPVEKLIQSIKDDPAVPLFWGANQKGMQAGEECGVEVNLFDPETGGDSYLDRKAAWLWARDQAIIAAKGFAEAGYHKQLVNRLLEPFGHITVVCTAAQWSNFFALRRHKDVEPHMHLLADMIHDVMSGSTPRMLKLGQWHLPFVSEEEVDDVWLDQFGGNQGGDPEAGRLCSEVLRKLSVARCASTSYKTVEGFDMTIERAEAIYAKLAGSVPLHASPFEHQATPARPRLIHGKVDWTTELGGNLGNAWVQYRKTLSGECQ